MDRFPAGGSHLRWRRDPEPGLRGDLGGAGFPAPDAAEVLEEDSGEPARNGILEGGRPMGPSGRTRLGRSGERGFRGQERRCPVSSRRA